MNTSKSLVQWVVSFVLAVALVLILRNFAFITYTVHGISMEPNFREGDMLIVNKFSYNFHKPERGDAVVIRMDDGSFYLKRVIAIPGDTVEIVGDNVYVNGELLHEPYLIKAVQKSNKDGTPYNLVDQEPYTVSEGHVFVVGDNRSHSVDSRFLGAIPINDIIGRPDFIFYPLKHIGFVQHGPN